ncbi:MAG TPA: sensor histidine kinase [Galbitalea sp.]|jgi:signal transduction histidine kinase|nr:sensor histidine kinase [Galbitalea sp.]
MFNRLTRGRAATDIVIAVVYLLLGAQLTLNIGHYIQVPAIVGLAVALGFRRFSPALALASCWAVALFQLYVANITAIVPDLAILAVLYATAVYGSRTVRWLGFASIFVGALLGGIYLKWGNAPPSFGITFRVQSLAEAALQLVEFGFYLALLVALLGLPWTAGNLVRTRRLARESRLAEQSAQLEVEAAEQDVIVEQERNRIARDMHDVVAHSLAVVIAQADGARYAQENDPGAVDGALSAISATARDALADVRLLLGQLRHPQSEGPQPALADLNRLLDQLRASGLTISFTTKGKPLQLGTGQQLAVYRIVQEALTNVLRHGDAKQEVVVRFQWATDELMMKITSAVTAAPATAELRLGHGLAGMKERAALVGGSLTTAVDDKHFVVSANIPATATASSTAMTASVTKVRAIPTDNKAETAS